MELTATNSPFGLTIKFIIGIGCLESVLWLPVNIWIAVSYQPSAFSKEG